METKLQSLSLQMLVDLDLCLGLGFKRFKKTLGYHIKPIVYYLEKTPYTTDWWISKSNLVHQILRSLSLWSFMSVEQLGIKQLQMESLDELPVEEQNILQAHKRTFLHHSSSAQLMPNTPLQIQSPKQTTKRSHHHPRVFGLDLYWFSSQQIQFSKTA